MKKNLLLIIALLISVSIFAEPLEENFFNFSSIGNVSYEHKVFRDMASHLYENTCDNGNKDRIDIHMMILNGNINFGFLAMTSENNNYNSLRLLNSDNPEQFVDVKGEKVLSKEIKDNYLNSFETELEKDEVEKLYKILDWENISVIVIGENNSPVLEVNPSLSKAIKDTVSLYKKLYEE